MQYIYILHVRKVQIILFEEKIYKTAQWFENR